MMMFSRYSKNINSMERNLFVQKYLCTKYKNLFHSARMEISRVSRFVYLFSRTGPSKNPKQEKKKKEKRKKVAALIKY